MEYANGVGEQVHADPEGIDAGRGFQYREVVESRGVQAQCRGEPADSGAGDNYLHALAGGSVEAAACGVCNRTGSVWLT